MKVSATHPFFFGHTRRMRDLIIISVCYGKVGGKEGGVEEVGVEVG